MTCCSLPFSHSSKDFAALVEPVRGWQVLARFNRMAALLPQGGGHLIGFAACL